MSKRTTFNTSEEQLQDLYDALKGGAPLLLALQYAQINRATYYYWVTVASIVEEYRSQKELEDLEKSFNSGISIQDVRDLSESVAANKKTGVGVFVEPSAESILQYKNNRKFKKFADKCYEVVSECNKIRSQLALIHLSNIKKSTDKGSRINASGSMWFLERTLSDFFAKPSDKVIAGVEEKAVIEPVKVEYVNPNSPETKDRVSEMETDLLSKFTGEGNA